MNEASEYALQRFGVNRAGMALLWLGRRPWLLSALLCTPVYIIYACNFLFLPPGAHGTGFIQFDQPYYMANARAYFSDGHFSLTYGLPFSSDPSTPKIYFQPLTFLLGALLYLTGSDPGLLYMTAGIIIAICCGRIIIACYRQIVPESDLSSLFGLVCFFWGGGLLALSGIAYGILFRQRIADTWYQFEPFNGWWFLNLGRNLFYTTEAFYHLLALAALICQFRGRYLWTFLIAALLSISHPFTGLEFIGILGAAALLELRFAATRPLQLLVLGMIALGALHLFYYLYFLNHVSLDHRLMQPQWRIEGPNGVNQPIPWMTTVLSQALVAPFAIVALFRQWRESGSFNYHQRILIVMWLVVFAFSHHNWVMKPFQPMHFLRGYDWVALFLIGAPVLVELFERLLTRRPSAWFSILVVFALFLFDNAGFVAAQVTLPIRKGNNLGYVLDNSDRAVLAKLGEPQFRNCVLLSDDPKIASLSVTYASIRAYFARVALTPDDSTRAREQSELFRKGVEPATLARRCTLALVPASEAASVMPRIAPLGYKLIYQNERFLLMQKKATMQP